MGLPEAFFYLNRDRNQCHNLIQAQLKERQSLQAKIMEVRNHHTKMLLGLYRHASHYRRLEKDKQVKPDNPNNRDIQRKRDNSLDLD